MWFQFLGIKTSLSNSQGPIPMINPWAILCSLQSAAICKASKLSLPDIAPICVQTSPPCSVLCSKKMSLNHSIARFLNLVRIWIKNSRLTIFAFTLWFELFDAIYSFINFYVATHFPVISLKPFSCSIISSAPYSFNDFWGLYLI